jgi:hypothetical protein
LTKVGAFLNLLNTKKMENILKKLEAFTQANHLDKDVLITKEKDMLTLELYSLLLKAEKKGYCDGYNDSKPKNEYKNER